MTSRYRIFLDQPLQVAATLLVTEQPFHHLKNVLRIRVGEPVVFFNGDGSDYSATITGVGKREIAACIDGQRSNENESPLALTLGLGISKGERMDFAIQKSVELGVTALVPLLCARSQNLPVDRLEKKQQHWQRIAISAAEQCGRSRIVQISRALSLDAWLGTLPTEMTRLVFDPSGSSISSLPESLTDIALLIGPEGGFTDEELATTSQHRCQSIMIGPRILRTETAPISAISLLQYRYGDFR